MQFKVFFSTLSYRQRDVQPLRVPFLSFSGFLSCLGMGFDLQLRLAHQTHSVRFRNYLGKEA